MPAGNGSLTLKPWSPETGTNTTSDLANPTDLRNGPTLPTISSNRSFDHSTSSPLLMATIICLTPAVLARMACSRVCPPLSNPVSNSPVRAEITSTATSACDAPPIM
eukprot:Amastigsp_a342495_104.p4 type:complete len:107 gc:universal Amastigsp_a342495_104:711-1031(+)